jgi:exosortase A-associated hydrolase 2
MTSSLVNAFFLPVEPGSRFCIYHEPVAGAGTGRGIVYVHPFGEEMNKARRMVALQCRRLAAAGWAVLQIDLLGCGDSSGDYGEASWELWRRDVEAAVGWHRQQLKGGTISLWGLRLGATLAADVAKASALAIEELLLWQPVVNGEQFLTQFLRLQLAAEMLSAGAAQSGVKGLRDALAHGESLEIAGYLLNPGMAAAISSLNLTQFFPAVTRVHWLEVTAQPEPKISPASGRAIEAWREKGLDIRASAVSGEPFWSTLEITECPALLNATDVAMNAKASHS